MKERIRQVYKHQRTGISFELILSARDVNTLMDMFYFEKIIIKDDYKRMQAVKAKADEIVRLKAQVEEQRRLAEASIRNIKNQRETIQSSIAENKSMIERLQKDKSYYERTERELARQSASIQSMIAGLSKKSGQPQVKVSSTGFIWPIRGPVDYITFRISYPPDIQKAEYFIPVLISADQTVGLLKLLMMVV